MADDRFKTVVGRSWSKARFCHHDRTTLPALRGKNGPDKKHVPLLCDVDRAKPLRRNLPDTALGSYRCKGSNDDTPFPAGTGCCHAFPAPDPSEKKPRISHPFQQRSLISRETSLSTMKAERKSAIATFALRLEGTRIRRPTYYPRSLGQSPSRQCCKRSQPAPLPGTFLSFTSAIAHPTRTALSMATRSGLQVRKSGSRISTRRRSANRNAHPSSRLATRPPPD